MLVPIVNIYVHNRTYYSSYFAFCPWHLSVGPAGLSVFPFGISNISSSHLFSWPLNLLLVVSGETEDTVSDRPLSTLETLSLPLGKLPPFLACGKPWSPLVTFLRQKWGAMTHGHYVTDWGYRLGPQLFSSTQKRFEGQRK